MYSADGGVRKVYVGKRGHFCVAQEVKINPP